MPKTILLTGATDGIGLVTAEKLVKLGHNLIIHGRSAEKIKVTEEKLKSIGSGSVTSYRADLADLSEVETLAQSIIKEHSQLDVVINNAGIYKTNKPITKDGLDVRFVVNTLSPYHLTLKLLSLMGAKSRVINLSSAAQAPVDFEALIGKHTIEDQFSAYAQSKLAITMWTTYLSTKLGNDNPSLIAINPGSLLASKMVKEGFGIAGKDINIGADILVKASLDEEFSRASGMYYDNDIADFTAAHSDSQNLEKCKRLIKEMEHLIERLLAD